MKIIYKIICFVFSHKWIKHERQSLIYGTDGDEIKEVFYKCSRCNKEEVIKTIIVYR